MTDEKYISDSEKDFNLSEAEEEERELSSEAEFTTKDEKRFHVDSSARMYLKEISNIPLLDIEKEKLYGEQLFNARKISDKIAKCAKQNEEYHLTEEEKKILELGENAKEQLVNHNLRLVIATAKKYLNNGLDFMDLVQEGNMGILKAIRKFDYRKGYKFSTYATWWIRQSISRAVADKGRTIRLPVHMVETISQIKKAEHELSMTLGRQPNFEEISEKTGIPYEKIEKIKTLSQSLLSLEQKVGDEDDSHLEDFVSDDSQITPFDYTRQKRLEEDVNKMLDKNLNDKEKLVIEYRFGLNNKPALTLEEIAHCFNPPITRERVRQIEKTAMEKIANSKEKDVLKTYTDEKSK